MFHTWDKIGIDAPESIADSRQATTKNMHKIQQNLDIKGIK